MTPAAQPSAPTDVSMSSTTDRRCAVGDLLRHWAAVRPESTCCGLDDHVFTFEEMDTRADEIAAGVAALGVGKGDRVATLAPNRVEILELFYGLARAGAVQVPLNAYLKGSLLRHQLVHSRPKVLILDEAGRRAVEPFLDQLPELETIVLLDGQLACGPAACQVDEVPYGDLCGRNAVKPDVHVTAEDTMSIVYTSGTTGLPKGCIVSHGYYCRCGQLIGDALELRQTDVIFSSLPLFHSGGRLMMLMSGLYRGLPVRLESAFSTSSFFRRISETGATVAIGVGPMGAALLAAPPGQHDRGHSLRTMMVSPMAPPAQQAFRARFGIEPWTEVFGQSECVPVTMTPLSSPDRDPVSCGAPAPDLEIAVLDDDGDPVADGGIGEICLRPKGSQFSMFDGYWEQPGDTLRAFRHLWYHTGDYGRRLPSGSLAFVDRKKDAIRRRGENVSSVELEGVINTQPDILESAVHAVPSALEEDDIKACIVPRDGAQLDAVELFHFFAENLPYFAVPRYVEIVETLPRNAVGRVMKHVLRERGITESGWDFESLGLTVARELRR